MASIPEKEYSSESQAIAWVRSESHPCSFCTKHKEPAPDVLRSIESSRHLSIASKKSEAFQRLGAKSLWEWIPRLALPCSRFETNPSIGKDRGDAKSSTFFRGLLALSTAQRGMNATD